MEQSKDKWVFLTHNHKEAISETDAKEAISETGILPVLKWSVTTHKIIMLNELHGIRVEKYTSQEVLQK